MINICREDRPKKIYTSESEKFKDKRLSLNHTLGRNNVENRLYVLSLEAQDITACLSDISNVLDLIAMNMRQQSMVEIIEIAVCDANQLISEIENLKQPEELTMSELNKFLCEYIKIGEKVSCMLQDYIFISSIQPRKVKEEDIRSALIYANSIITLCRSTIN